MKIKPINFTMGDKVECPDCQGTNTYMYDRDTANFHYTGIGHINTDHHCKDCNRNFRLHTNFKYQITEQQTGY